MKILVVEDDPAMADLMNVGLSSEGYEVVVCRTAEQALDWIRKEPFDLLLLDVELPGRDGFAVLQEARSRRIQAPVIIVSGGRKTTADRIRGLNLGADDYLVKPFAFKELLARIRAVRRRADAVLSGEWCVSDLRIRIDTHSVWRGATAIDLTPREFDLLAYLARHQGEVVTREMLAREVWHEMSRATPIDNVIDVHISRLRQKIDEGREPKLIHTIRGAGYTLRG